MTDDEQRTTGAVRGWVTIQGGIIAAITVRKPADALGLATDGVILPGLIDLHGHPEFNVFAPWEPPKAVRQPVRVARQQGVRRLGP